MASPPVTTNGKQAAAVTGEEEGAWKQKTCNESTTARKEVDRTFQRPPLSSSLPPSHEVAPPHVSNQTELPLPLPLPLSNHKRPRLRPRRRSRRGHSLGMDDLAKRIVQGDNVIFVTGAGLSVASGVRPFRGKEGVWSMALWTKATREAFRKEPLQWYNEFWLPLFCHDTTYSTSTSSTPSRSRSNSRSRNTGHGTKGTRPPSTEKNAWNHHRTPLRIHPNDGHRALEQITQLQIQATGTATTTTNTTTNTNHNNVKIITQNIDGLQSISNSNHLIEAHGRLGLYKCLPEEDSDTDSDSDDDANRPVHLGHRRKSRLNANCSTAAAATITATSTTPPTPSTSSAVKCKYEWKESIPVESILPPHVRDILAASTLNSRTASTHAAPPTSTSTATATASTSSSTTQKVAMDTSNNNNSKDPLSSKSKAPHQPPQPQRQHHQDSYVLSHPPTCPSCHRPCPPQALLFDEGYHSHDFYQFERMEDWLGTAHVLVFVGTSFAVRITKIALDHAKASGIPVYNFNMPPCHPHNGDVLEATPRLDATNIMGPSHETLPKLYQACLEQMELLK